MGILGVLWDFKNIMVFLPYVQSYYTLSFSFIRLGRVLCVRSVPHLLALALGKEMRWVKLLETIPKPSSRTHPPQSETRLGGGVAFSTTRGAVLGW